MATCQFGANEVEFLRRMISPSGVDHPRSINPKVLTNTQVPTNKERTPKIHRFCKILSKLHPPIIGEIRPLSRAHQIGQTSQNRPRTDNQL